MWKDVNPPPLSQNVPGESENPYMVDEGLYSVHWNENPKAAKLALLETVSIGPEKTVDEIKLMLTELNRQYVITSVRLNTYSIQERSYKGLAPESDEVIEEKVNAVMALCPKPPLNYFMLARGDRRVFEFRGPGIWSL